MDNRHRQENEVLLLSSIYNQSEFSYIKNDIIEIYYNIFLTINGKVIKLKNLHKTCSECLITYLPPIRLYIQLPIDYPTYSSPNFYIISSWLTPWQVSLLCQQLDDIWLDNKGQEILFLWFEFLRNNLLNFLQIKDILDISFLYLIRYKLTDYFKLNVMFPHDVRAICNTLLYNPINFFMDYNNHQLKLKFENSYHVCGICFEVCSGQKCIEFQNCSHIYCRNCVQEYISAKINENMVKDIKCPDFSCDFNITYNEIKILCSNLFLKYEDLLLNLTLNSMEDIVFCPRISCQCPVVNVEDNTLITCSKCNYSFCSHCHKLYHGVTPCTILSEEMVQLIENYENGNEQQKQLLKKKYGKKQIQEVEKHISKKYLKENTKACPNCQTPISKIEGCNKIICVGCNAYFCWICGVLITTSNPYEHFLMSTNKCYRRLFD